MHRTPSKPPLRSDDVVYPKEFKARQKLFIMKQAVRSMTAHTTSLSERDLKEAEQMLEKALAALQRTKNLTQKRNA